MCLTTLNVELVTSYKSMPMRSYHKHFRVSATQYRILGAVAGIQDQTVIYHYFQCSAIPVRALSARLRFFSRISELSVSSGGKFCAEIPAPSAKLSARRYYRNVLQHFLGKAPALSGCHKQGLCNSRPLRYQRRQPQPRARQHWNKQIRQNRLRFLHVARLATLGHTFNYASKRAS
jgi:hypothetical protein